MLWEWLGWRKSHFLWLQAGHVPCCFVVLYARGDAPLAADWKKGRSHFTCTAEEVFKQCILAAEDLNGVQMQHFKLEQPQQLAFASVGAGCIFCGCLAVPQGIPRALSANTVPEKERSQFLMENHLADESGSDL